MLSNKEIELKTNSVGLKANPKFKFIRLMNRKQNGHRMVEIQNLETKEKLIKNFYNLKKGSNPWTKRGYSLNELKEKVNKVGLKSTPKFIFINDTGKRQGHNRFISIQNVTTKEIKNADLGNILKGRNPWNKECDRHEHSFVHPKIKGFLNKFNITIDQEVKISKRSRVDFICTNTLGKKILIEVKSDKKWHSSNDLKKQIKKYQTDGKIKFGKNYLKTYLVSLNGTYGYSMKELKMILKQDKFL